MKAFDNGRFDYLKVLLSCREPKLNNSTYDQALATLISNIIAKYDKNKELSTSVIKLLAENNHSQAINRMHKNGVFPMTEAIKKGNPHLVQDLLMMSPNLDLQDKSGVTSWDMAQKGTNKEIARILSEYKDRMSGYNMGRGIGPNGYTAGSTTGAIQGGQPLPAKAAKGDSRRAMEPAAGSGMQYGTNVQGSNGNSTQMGQG
jgi:ankyrin repeat protein